MTQQQPTPGYPQPQGYGPPHGYPPPQGHPPPPKKSGGLALVLLGVVLGVLGVVGVGAYLVYDAQASGQARQERVAQQQVAQRQAVEAAKVAAQEQKAQEINAIISAPGSYLQASDYQTFDKGIVNSYRQLTGITILNTAHYAVTDIQGNVTFLDDQGRQFGTLPFSLRGSIPAGATQVFSARDGTLNSGTLQGKASKLSVAFTHVRVIQ